MKKRLLILACFCFLGRASLVFAHEAAPVLSCRLGWEMVSARLFLPTRVNLHVPSSFEQADGRLASGEFKDPAIHAPHLKLVSAKQANDFIVTAEDVRGDSLASYLCSETAPLKRMTSNTR